MKKMNFYEATEASRSGKAIINLDSRCLIDYEDIISETWVLLEDIKNLPNQFELYERLQKQIDLYIASRGICKATEEDYRYYLDRFVHFVAYRLTERENITSLNEIRIDHLGMYKTYLSTVCKVTVKEPLRYIRAYFKWLSAVSGIKNIAPKPLYSSNEDREYHTDVR